MALTIGNSTADACAEIAQNAVREGATTTINDSYKTNLFIQYAQTDATAHAGTRIIVQVSSNTTGDEDWVTHTEFGSKTGTGNLEVITNNPATAGTTVFTVADTAGYVADGVLEVFLEDVTTFANSEWLSLVSAVTNTSATMLDGSTREHAQNSILNNIAKTYKVELEVGYSRVRVIYDNTYDSDGATVATRCRIAQTTAL